MLDIPFKCMCRNKSPKRYPTLIGFAYHCERCGVLALPDVESDEGNGMIYVSGVDRDQVKQRIHDEHWG